MIGIHEKTRQSICFAWFWYLLKQEASVPSEPLPSDIHLFQIGYAVF